MDQKSAIEIGRKYLALLLQRNLDVKRIYLFGSYAKGNQRAESDIDLAIFLRGLEDPFDMQVRLLKLTWNFDTRVEPHVFDEEALTSSEPIIRDIMQTGIEIPVFSPGAA